MRETGLGADNYCSWFICLLRMEEMQMERDIRNFDTESTLKEVMPRSKIRLLELEVYLIFMMLHSNPLKYL